MNVLSPFGDPMNPFNEEGLAPQKLATSARRSAAEIINFFRSFPESITETRAEDGTNIRTLDYTFRAYFEPTLGIYTLNVCSDTIAQRVKKTVKFTAHMRLADYAIEGEVTKRSITLMHPEGERFGVSDVSRILPNDTFEKWDTISVSLGLQDGIPQSEVWAETGTTSQLLTEQDGRNLSFFPILLGDSVATSLERMGGRHMSLQ